MPEPHTETDGQVAKARMDGVVLYEGTVEIRPLNGHNGFMRMTIANEFRNQGRAIMLNTDSTRMQTLFQNREITVSSRRLDSLARKGKRLYKRHVSRPGIFVEGFVAYHLWRGEYAVARDFLAYLRGEMAALEDAVYLHSAEKRRLESTRDLAGRVEALMQDKITA